MALSKWTKISDEILFKNNWWEYHRDNYTLPSGISGEYNYIQTLGSSLIIPILLNNKIIMVNQYRYLVDKESLEFPCGSVKVNDTYIETAKKELLEETNYSSEEWTILGKFNPYNGVTNEMCEIYIARNLTFSQGIPDETEEFEIHAKSINEIDELIKNDVIWDGMTLAAYALFKTKFKI